MSTSSRMLLPASKVHAEAARQIAAIHPDTLREIESAIATHDVVVVGMAQNPHVKNVRLALAKAGIAYTYLEYGSYLSQWRRRLAIKMWSGWPTFPQVFVRGQLVGGEDLTKAAIANGTLSSLLAAPRA